MILRTIYTTLIFVFVCQMQLLSEDGDTNRIRTIEFNTDRAGWYEFPNAGETSYRKVIMNFKIKCPDGKSCGEWDYVSNVFVDHYFAPNYRLNGKSPNSAGFMLDTSWSFKPELVNDVWVLTRTPKPRIVLENYNINAEFPTKAVDSLYVWSVYYTYTMDANGNLTDSTLVEPDSTIHLTKKRVYFNDAVTVRERFEIMRYITPYGNGLKLGDGWLYTIDVTDFLPLLSGDVYIFSPCGGWGDQKSNTDQEALELSFEFIEGTPTRQIVRFEKFQEHNYAVYNEKFENLFPAKSIQFSNTEKGARLKVIQTGHGFNGNDDDCSEFCKKGADVKVDGTARYARYIWRECGDMALHPQGGTWLADRTNWCPGMDVEYHDYELSPFITPGGTHTVDYSMEFYNKPFTTGSNEIPHWIISSYLITYGEPNFSLDADLLDVITPSKKQAHLRLNPACFNYTVLVRNNGKDSITRIDFKFGFEGDETVNTYTWTGKLRFLDTATVIFDNFFRDDDFESERKYFVEIASVNGQPDEYASNNFGYSMVTPTPFFPNDLSINLRTNKYASQQYEFVVRDSQWNIIKQRLSFNDNTSYNEAMTLPDGCYDFQLTNKLGYGLYYPFIVDQVGTGSLNISSRGLTLKNYPTNFGNYIYQQFKVGQVIEASYSTDTVRFAQTDVDIEVESSFEISPKNNKALTINSLNMFLGASYGFRIISSVPELTEGNTVTLQPGEKMVVTVGFKPKKSGNAATNLSIGTNDYYNPDRSIRLVGFATDPDGVEEEIAAKPTLRVRYNESSMIVNIAIETKSNFQNSTIKVYDSMGNLVESIYNNQSFNGADEFEYNADRLSSGVYHFVLTNGNISISKALAIAK